VKRKENKERKKKKGDYFGVEFTVALAIRKGEKKRRKGVIIEISLFWIRKKGGGGKGGGKGKRPLSTLFTAWEEGK